MNMQKHLCLVMLIVSPLLSGCQADKEPAVRTSPQEQSTLLQRWWPQQTAPKVVYQTIDHEHFEAQASPGGRETSGHVGTTHMMIQSLSGLAARAVNEGRSDAMIWISVGHPRLERNPDYAMHYQGLKNRLGFEERGPLPSWELLEVFIQKGVVDRYVLYRYDFSDGEPYTFRADADMSVNAATMAAAAEGALLIEEGQQEQAEALGLKMVFDARDKSVGQVFEMYKDRLSRNYVAAIDPKAAHNRAFVLAYPCPVAICMVDPVPAMLEWTEPLSPVIGYMWHDEGGHTHLVSSWGHFNTATNWALNLPLFLAGSQEEVTFRAAGVDPRTIDFENTPYAAAFMLSDGDNMNWLMGDFYNNRFFWANPHRNEFPMSWTSCFVNLGQVANPPTEILLRTKPFLDSFVEYGAGYQFPDVFAVNRSNRPELLEQFAKRAWSRMEMNNVRVFGFLCHEFHSPGMLEAAEIYARHMPGLTGMIAVQYHPHEGGEGDILWVTNADGIDIPVVRASFTMWSDYASPYGGSPARVARLVNEATAKARQEARNSYNWIFIHAWSGFQKIDDDDETAEYGHFEQPGYETGPVPAKWAIDRFDPDVKTVSLEELLWLIRMDRNPKQTRRAIEGFTP